jgi:hypothetical protein
MKTVLILETNVYATKYELAQCQNDDTGYNVTETGTVEDLDSLESLEEQADEVYETQSLGIKNKMTRIK